MEFVRRTPSSEAPAGDSSDSLAPRAAAPHELVMQWFAQIWQHLPQFFDVQPEQDRWDSAAAEEYAAEDNGRGHPSAAAPPSAPSLTTPSPEVAEGASRQLMRRLSRVAMNKNEAESSAGKAAGPRRESLMKTRLVDALQRLNVGTMQKPEQPSAFLDFVRDVAPNLKDQLNMLRFVTLEDFEAAGEIPRSGSDPAFRHVLGGPAGGGTHGGTNRNVSQPFSNFDRKKTVFIFISHRWLRPPHHTSLGDTWLRPPHHTSLGDTWLRPPHHTSLGDTWQVAAPKGGAPGRPAASDAKAPPDRRGVQAAEGQAEAHTRVVLHRTMVQIRMPSSPPLVTRGMPSSPYRPW